jgi:hypothetical protein
MQSIRQNTIAVKEHRERKRTRDEFDTELTLFISSCSEIVNSIKDKDAWNIQLKWKVFIMSNFRQILDDIERQLVECLTKIVKTEKDRDASVSCIDI